MSGEVIDFHLALLGRLACLEVMLQKMVREHATIVGHEHERAEYLAEAICDLRTMIDRLRDEHPHGAE